ncbi:hypothetical protein SPI_00793 [Niveomyces insectorum RCEF 264]|uniref:Uncharacterized protein n=1 Tax=Niveomyces insectorum RCEF 264 TaxID=1081102 RepID=A0A168ADH6_9HYPO|nr:hypothetical protein SPI_00793 [Niveomyces insectorum RCEF 264]
MAAPTRRDPFAGADAPTIATSSTRRMAASTGAPASTAASAVQSSAMHRNDESWVEIASQPSSSSLSSIADEIVITGLRVGNSASGLNGGPMPQRRRRLLQQVEAAAGAPSPTSHPPSVALPSADGSSQEEYDETESEGDQLMASSAENVHVRHPATPPQSLFSLQQQQRQQQQQEQQQPQQRAAASGGGNEHDDGEDGDDDDDDDDDGTALGMPSSGPPTFRPQPNAFTHPPSYLQQQQRHQQQHRSVPTPPHHRLAGSPYARPMAHRSQTRPSRGSQPPDFMFPSYREDNDAALRASLTTLLSCAAAARGLPKEDNSFRSAPSAAMSSGVRPSTQPMDLRLVPESELMGDASVAPPTRAISQPSHMRPQASPHPGPSRGTSHSDGKEPRQAAAVATAPPGAATTQQSSRSSAVSAASTSGKSKRTAAAAGATSGSPSKSPRATKKKRTASASAADGDAAATFLSPTLLTWVVSAGVVVLVSVVGFGAGFVIGREVGRQEASSAMQSGGFGNAGAANASSSCGREIMRSSTGSTLRRFRWGAGMARSVTA